MKKITIAAVATAVIAAATYVAIRKGWIDLPESVTDRMPDSLNKHFSDAKAASATKAAAGATSTPAADSKDTIKDVVPETGTTAAPEVPSAPAADNVAEAVTKTTDAERPGLKEAVAAAMNAGEPGTVGSHSQT